MPEWAARSKLVPFRSAATRLPIRGEIRVDFPGSWSRMSRPSAFVPVSRYQNLHPHSDHGLPQILRWKLGLGPREQRPFPEAGDDPAPSVPVDMDLIHTPMRDGVRATWLGHASWLIQLAGRAILVDPIFSDYCAPVPLPGMKRFQAPGVLPHELPAIDAVLLTHSHYDHLDLSSLRCLPGEPVLALPIGHRQWMRSRGFTRLAECAWGESTPLADPLVAHAVPAQHFTARTLFDRNRGHWCGWVVKAAGTRLYLSGDTGYAPIFTDIARDHGPFDLAVLPIGAYAPRWVMSAVHLDPSEAVRVHLEVGAKCSLASHWGTFRLTDEPMAEPPLWLAEERQAAGITSDQFRVLHVGETTTI